jgi:hypothetical protein
MKNNDWRPAWMNVEDAPGIMKDHGCVTCLLRFEHDQYSSSFLDEDDEIPLSAEDPDGDFYVSLLPEADDIKWRDYTKSTFLNPCTSYIVLSTDDFVFCTSTRNNGRFRKDYNMDVLKYMEIPESDDPFQPICKDEKPEDYVLQTVIDRMVQQPQPKSLMLYNIIANAESDIIVPNVSNVETMLFNHNFFLCNITLHGEGEVDKITYRFINTMYDLKIESVAWVDDNGYFRFTSKPIHIADNDIVSISASLNHFVSKIEPIVIATSKKLFGLEEESTNVF